MNFFACRAAKGKSRKNKKPSGREGINLTVPDIVINIPGIGSVIEGACHGAKHIEDLYTRFRNGQVHRSEAIKNGEAMRGAVSSIKAFASSLATRNTLKMFNTFLI